jgi:hypothetical protein
MKSKDGTREAILEGVSPDTGIRGWNKLELEDKRHEKDEKLMIGHGKCIRNNQTKL